MPARAGRPARRVLRQDRQGQRLGQREPARILAEIDEARRRGALDVAAVGQEVQVRLQDVPLGVTQLELERARDLHQLAPRCGGADAVEKTGELHRDGRAALTPPARDVCPPPAAHQRERIHARVEPEHPVLLQQRGVDQQRRHPVERHPDPVLLVGRERQAQQTTAPIVDGGGRGKARPQRLMPNDAWRHPPRGRAAERGDAGAPQPADCHGRRTTIRPGGDQARTPRSYIPSP